MWPFVYHRCKSKLQWVLMCIPFRIKKILQSSINHSLNILNRIVLCVKSSQNGWIFLSTHSWPSAQLSPSWSNRCFYHQTLQSHHQRCCSFPLSLSPSLKTLFQPPACWNRTVILIRLKLTSTEIFFHLSDSRFSWKTMNLCEKVLCDTHSLTQLPGTNVSVICFC